MDIHGCAATDDAWEPEDEAVEAHAPAEIQQCEEEDVGPEEGLADTADVGDGALLGGEFLLEREGGCGAHPFGFAWAVADEGDPDNGPEDGGDALDDEGHLPAERVDEVAGDRGHPEDGGGVAEDEEGVGAGAFGAGEPVGEDDEHRGEDDAFGDAKQEAVDGEEPELVDDAGKGGERSPEDERGEDEAAGAAAADVGGPGDLEDEVAQEEEGAEEGGAGGGDVERFGKASGGTKAVVGAVEVGERVGDVDGGEDVEPAFAAGRVGRQVMGRFGNADFMRCEH